MWLTTSSAWSTIAADSTFEDAGIGRVVWEGARGLGRPTAETSSVTGPGRLGEATRAGR